MSSAGEVRCLERLISRRGRNGTVHQIPRPAKILTPKVRGEYLAVQLFGPLGSKFHSIHRLVAMAFCEGVLRDFVNHKDEDKHNNAASNLEWCTASYNQRYSRGHPICLLSPHGAVEHFDSKAEASEKTGMSLCSVWRLTSSPNITVKGWRVVLSAV